MNKNIKKKVLYILLIIIVLFIIIFLLIFYKNRIELFNNINTNTDTTNITNITKITNIENIESNKFEDTSVNVKNPYIKGEHQDIIWQNLDSEFMKNNYPSNFDFEYDIKEDIINKALTLPVNSCIIDCGAHIGDGSIAIAHALKYNKRDDIMIYAIDPSKYKCEFIEFIKNKNNLNNITVLNYGLSNINSTYQSNMLNENNDNKNTGSWMWTLIDTKSNTDTINNSYNINKFIKLDDLVNNNIIKENIGILHLDVEGMEQKALNGALNTIIKNKPYISIENNSKSGKDINGNENSKNNEYFLKFLPQGYKYIYNKNNNNILIYE